MIIIPRDRSYAERNNMVKVSEDGYSLVYESGSGWHILLKFKSERQAWKYSREEKLDVLWECHGTWMNYSEYYEKKFRAAVKRRLNKGDELRGIEQSNRPGYLKYEYISADNYLISVEIKEPKLRKPLEILNRKE